MASESNCRLPWANHRSASLAPSPLRGGVGDGIRVVADSRLASIHATMCRALQAWQHIGGDRYDLIRRLGEGGLGVVYEAHDRDRDHRVALKTLRRPTQEAIFGLKQEFRNLSGVEHPNLVNLYDLHATPEAVFITMELVAGTDFIHFLQAEEVDQSAPTMQLKQRILDCDEASLRRVLAQLAAGLDALHAAGMVHRDIKPSNVLVTPDGKVKILDFGLAFDLQEFASFPSQEAIVGTLAYMSPEQASSEPRLGPATDWYSFGVMLYQALSGSLPFQGRPIAVLAQKTQEAPPSVREVCPRVPEDLAELCDELLVREPSQRIRGNDVLRRLANEDSETPDLSLARPRRDLGEDSIFVGRQAELQALLAAFQTVQDTRRAHTVVISGPSGIGKTTFLQVALRNLEQQYSDLATLRGRCYEWESLSYNAMDGVIDELSSHWLHMTGQDATRLLPDDAYLLPVIFPVLARVRAVARCQEPKHSDAPSMLRQRAFAAIRETFDNFARERPLVLLLDDMQWADQESVDLLMHLLRAPDAPPILLLLATRPQGLAAKTRLTKLLAELGTGATTIEIPKLSDEEATEAARYLLGAEHVTLAQRVAAEALGNPFYLSELAHHMRHPQPGKKVTGSVDDLIRRRVAQLDELERRLLEDICVSGEPLLISSLLRVAELSPEHIATSIKSLRHKNLLRSSGGHDAGSVEPYHDRVRHAVAETVAQEEARATHERIALVLEKHEEHAEARLVRHWLHAGNKSKSGRWARKAAATAHAQLDFLRASEFLQFALSCETLNEREEQELLVQIGEAFEEAGRPMQAADSYQRAIEFVEGADEFDLRRRIVENLLFAGDVAKGVPAAEALAKETHLALPTSRVAKILHLVRNDLRMKRFNLDDGPPAEGGLPNPSRRVQVAESLSKGLGPLDSLRSGVLTQQWARASLKLGLPSHCVRSLASLSILSSMQGAADKTDRLLRAARRWSKSDDSLSSQAYLAAGRAFSAYFVDFDWARTRAEFDLCRQHWHDAGRGSSHEMGIVRLFSALAAQQQGNMRELNEVISRETDAAVQTGNRFLEVSLRVSFAHRHLAADNAEQALGDLERGLARWPSKSEAFLLQHWFALQRRCEILLYQGDAEEALARLEEDRRAMRSALLHRVQLIDAEHSHLYGRAQLAIAYQHDGARRARALAGTQKAATRLKKHKRRVTRAWSSALLAGMANIRGDEKGSQEQLERCARLFEQADSQLYAYAARRQLGQVLGGEEGAKLVAKSALWMARTAIKNGDSMCRMLLPGWG